MAGKTVELNVRVKAALEGGDTLKSLRELKQVQKELVAGSADYNKISQRMADIKDKTKGATVQSRDLIDTLASAPGPLGMLGRGLDTITSSTNKFGLALKATGIGLVVALIAQLTTAFSSNEKAMKKLEPVLNGFQQILGGIFSALEPVFNTIVDLAVKAMPLLTSAIKVVYSGLSTLLQSIGKVGSSIAKLFSGDFKGAYDDAKSAVMDFGKTYTATAAAFDKGASDMTKKEKENAEARKKIREEELTRIKGDLDAKIELETKKENTSREKLQSLYKQKYEAEIEGQKLSEAQKLLLRKQYQQKVEEAILEDKAKRQKDYEDGIKLLQSNSKLQLDQLNANLTEQKVIYGENSKEARKTQDEIYQAQREALDKETELLNKKGDLTVEEKIRLKSIDIEQQNLTTSVIAENKKRLESDNAALLKKGEDTKKASDKLYQDKMSAAGADYELQQQILDDKIEQEKKFYEEQLAIIGLTDEQKKVLQEKQTADVKANADAQVQIQKAKTEAELAFLNASANAINAVADIIGKNTKTGKALAVAASLINTYSAIAGQLKAFAGVPIPGYAIAQAIATGLVGFKAVSDIVSVKVPESTAATSVPSGPSVSKPRGLAMGGYVSGGGTSTSDSIPALLSNGESVINAASTKMFMPLLSTINQIGGGRQFASGGVSSSEFAQSSAMTSLTDAIFAQQQPIKTYVVSSDMTNQQMMDRTIKMRSTI
jgi:hypothetical protein